MEARSGRSSAPQLLPEARLPPAPPPHPRCDYVSILLDDLGTNLPCGLGNCLQDKLVNMKLNMPMNVPRALLATPQEVAAGGGGGAGAAPR